MGHHIHFRRLHVGNVACIEVEEVHISLGKTEAVRLINKVSEQVSNCKRS